MPQVMTVDGSAPAVRVAGVWADVLHGFTPDGRLVLSGATPGAMPHVQRDVFVATTAGTSTNLTNTPSADEPLGAIAG